MTAEINNRISGCRTQLKRHAGGPREPELRRYLESLLAQRADLQLEQRLAELEARWEALVDRATAAAYGRPGLYRTETRWRNMQAKRRARRGLGRLETVAEEMRRLAEQRLLDTIDRHADERWARAARAEIDEAHELRLELQRRAEQRAGLLAA